MNQEQLSAEDRINTWRVRTMALAQTLSNEEKSFRYNGILYPTIMSPRENLEALKTLEARSDDVVLVAYPKCGFNWMVGVLRKIITAATGKKFNDAPPHLEFRHPDMQRALAEEASPRLMATHLHPDEMNPTFWEKKAKILVMWRNPKDTLVSFYHFMNNNPVLSNVEWNQFFSDFMAGDVLYGSYFDHAKAWEKLSDDPNVKMITYEQMKEDLAGGIREISQFFGFHLTEEQVKTISAESTFKAMKKNAVPSHGKFTDVLFRKGEVGDWKNQFIVAQSENMDKEFNNRLAGTKVGNLLKYDTYCK